MSFKKLLLFTDRLLPNLACGLIKHYGSFLFFVCSLVYIEICTVYFLLYKHWKPSWMLILGTSGVAISFEIAEIP